MAWLEECKFGFYATICTLTKDLGELKKALNQVSSTSDIPFETLKRWYYEVRKTLNSQDVNSDTSLETTDNSSDKQAKSGKTKKSKRGGKRKGAGRKPLHDPLPILNGIDKLVELTIRKIDALSEGSVEEIIKAVQAFLIILDEAKKFKQ